MRRDGAPQRWLIRLGLDTLVFLGLSGAFLFAYVGVYSAPSDAVLPHLRVILVLVLVLALARLLIAWFCHHRWWHDLAATLVVCLGLTAMLTFYALVLIGLQFWGQVTSWELVTSYAAQTPQLAEVLGVEPLHALIGLVAACGAVLALAYGHVRLLDWSAAGARSTSAPLLALLIAGGGSVTAIELYGFLAFPPTAVAEPLSLSLFPHASARNLQGHFIDPLVAAQQDRMEDAARAAYAPLREPTRTNVILIVVDALRPDHMGIYGYARDTTPFMSRLAREGVLRKAEGVRAVCSSSTCGLTSLVTSKFVHQFSYRPFSLYEALKRHGYAVHLVLGGDHTSFYGLKDLYGSADSYYDGGMHAASHDVPVMSPKRVGYANDDRLVLERLDTFAAWNGRPVLMQFHLMSAHALGKRWDEAARYQPAVNYVRLDARVPALPGTSGGTSENYYDNGVLQTDMVIERLLELLGRKGYLRDAIVAITADHGEALGEHGMFQHTHGVYEEFIRVPLALIGYGSRRARSIDVSRAGSQVDIAPTILAELGIPIPATWVGKPLQDPAQRQFTHFQEQKSVGLLDHRDPSNLWKYWADMARGEEFAFNLSMDPRESRNAVAAVPRELMREWRLQVMRGAPIAVQSRSSERAADHRD